MDSGVEVWIRQDGKDLDKNDDLWLPGTITKKVPEGSSFRIFVLNGAGKEHSYLTSSGSEETAELKFRNAHTQFELIQRTHNLIDLPHLNEPEILHGLQTRFCDHASIYTYAGAVLIAINPLSLVTPAPANQDLFLAFLAQIQANIRDNDDLSLSLSRDDNDDHAHVALPATLCHSILISGESGSGKTEVAKMLVKLMLAQSSSEHSKSDDSDDIAAISLSLATLTDDVIGLPSTPNKSSHSKSKDESRSLSLTHKVVQSAVVLEAFGNARTLHSANSSRFGQFLNLEFNRQGEAISGSVRTYLLENVRVVSQPLSERSFHIFYQLLAGAADTQLERYKLSRQSSGVPQYAYLSRGQVSLTEESVALDREHFLSLRSHMQAIGFSDSDTELVLTTIAGIIQLGETRFDAKFTDSAEGCDIANHVYADNETHLELVARLLSVSPTELAQTLTIKTMTSRGETFRMTLNAQAAANARDAIAKAIYRRVFDFIAREINSHLLACRPEDPRSRNSTQSAGSSFYVSKTRVTSRIGVLDVFGLDAFEVNSFEQLCINYANEALQSEFNRSMFQLELAEYESEGIALNEEISFKDNTKIMELLTQGIFRVLDDQCKLPNANDKRLAEQFYKNFENNPHFQASSAQKAKSHFAIVHFAGVVTYTTEGFIEKNLDELPSEGLQLLASSHNHIVSSAGPGAAHAVANKAPARKATPSAVTQYKAELGTLIQHVTSTTPHYIRCINPVHRAEHATNKPFASPDRRSSLTHARAPALTKELRFSQREVAEQLRYGGIFEALRVSRLGYPVRYPHLVFLQRYKCVVLMCARTSEIRRKNKALLSVALTHEAFETNRDRLKALCRTLIESLCEHAHRYEKPDAANVARKTNLVLLDMPVGVSKIFLKSSAHDALERMRNAALRTAVRRISRGLRHALTRARTKMLEKEALRCKQRQEHAAVTLQRVFRGFAARKMLRAMKMARRRISQLAEKDRLALERERQRERERVAQELQKGVNVNISAFPEELQPIILTARSARRARNLSTKVQEYKQRDERLLQEINMLIAAKRQSDEICLLRFDIMKAKVLLADWASLFAHSHSLRDRVSALAKVLAYGYELLVPEKLVSVSMTASLGLSMKAFGLGRPTSVDMRSAKNVNKAVTTDHKVFKSLYKILERIKELMEIAHAERLAIDERHRSRSSSLNASSHGAGSLSNTSTHAATGTGSFLMSDADVVVATGNITKVMDFCRILYQYYSQYITQVVNEYGEGSAYRQSFGEDDALYLKSLVQLFEQKKPLLSIEKQSVVSPYQRATSRSATQEQLFPTTISVFSLPLLPPPPNVVHSTAYNYARGERSVVFKYIRYAPGVEYAMNCLFTLLQREALMYPIRLIKLVGRSASNYGQVAYYQAAMHFSEETLRTVLDPEIDRYFAQHGCFPQDEASAAHLSLPIESLSYSVAVLCSALTHCVFHGEAENFMVLKNPHNNSARIVGVNNTKLFCDQLFLFDAESPQQLYTSKSAYSRGNILFSMPQFHAPIDEELRHSLLSNSASLVEELLSSWLRELYLQNKRYESLTTSGFTAEDLQALSVPITLPAGSVTHVYRIFKETIGLLAAHPTLTHAQLIAHLYPHLQISKSLSSSQMSSSPQSPNALYQHSTSFMLRKSSGRASGDEADGVPVESASYSDSDDERPSLAQRDKNDNNVEITVYNTSFYQSGGALQEFVASIEEVATDLLTQIDFSALRESDEGALTAGNMVSENASASLQACGVVSDNLSFLPALFLRGADELQLTVMFGGLVELAFRFTQDQLRKQQLYQQSGQQQASRRESMRREGTVGAETATYASKLFTKELALYVHDHSEKDALERSVIVLQIQSLVGIKVSIMCENDLQ